MNCDWELSHTFIAKRVGNRGALDPGRARGPATGLGQALEAVERSQIWHIQGYLGTSAVGQSSAWAGFLILADTMDGGRQSLPETPVRFKGSWDCSLRPSCARLPIHECL